VKLVDFGIARASADPASQTGLKGKISYMSPEQCRGRTVLDRRSDVFSVGTILYELTTGRLPFVDETEYGVLHQIVNRDAEPPSRLVPSYPPALEAIVMRALARDPDRRFSTALDLQNQVEDYAHDNRLRVSPLVLARLMSTLFPARLEEWDHARAQGAFFVEQHVVRTLIESGKASEGSPHMPKPLPPPDEGNSPLPGQTHAPEVDSERTELVPPLAAPRPAPPRMSAPPPSAIPGTPPQQRFVAQALLAPQPPVTPPAQHPPLPFAAHAPGPAQMPTQIMMPTPPPRMATPQPGVLHSSQMPAPGTTLPGPVPTPPPTMATPGARGSPRPAPVPNMPGAVPIMMPLPAPAGGTLVSPGMQAGAQPLAASQPVPAQPQPVQPMPMPYGAPAAGPNGPGAPASFGYSSGEYMPAPGYGQMRAPTGGDGQMAAHSVGDVTEQVRRSVARPTLIVRHRTRSRLPLVIAFVAVAGAAAGVWLAIGRDSSKADTVGVPAAASSPASGETATGAPAAKPPASADTAATAEPAAGKTEEPAAGKAAKPAEPSAPPAPPVAAGSEPPAPSADTGEAPGAAAKPTDTAAASADRADASSEPADKVDPKRKPAKTAAGDPRTRPPRAKGRGDKRVESKRTKTDAKEQNQWDNDSPFLPQSTPKPR
jgi:serine/threonine-protein kinase